MARPRQPVELLLHKGKTHLTKAEIEQRRGQEIRAPDDKIIPPSYLKTAKLKGKFERIAGELAAIGILSNLDCDALARYLQSEEKYLAYDNLVKKALRESRTLEKAAAQIVLLEKLENLRDKAFKQCRSAASDLGLTISSRCKLVIPKQKEQADQHAALFGDEPTG